MGKVGLFYNRVFMGKSDARKAMYANCMQMPKTKKGFIFMKPLTIVGGPCWARTSDPLIMSQML